MISEQVHFPDGFHWGASISAHQTEGGNNNDWTDWEHQNATALAEAANAGQDYGNGKNTVPDWPRIEPAAKDPANYISGNAVEH